jgi:hypothetical protein
MLGRDALIILVENVFAKENPICDSGGGLVQFLLWGAPDLYISADLGIAQA